MIAADVDFDELIFPEFPDEWQSASNLVEGMLLVAALELQKRRGINPWDPFADGVHERLPPQYRYDPFRSLLAFNSRGEFYGRLPLLSRESNTRESNASRYIPVFIWDFEGKLWCRKRKITPNNGVMVRVSRLWCPWRDSNPQPFP